MKMENVDVGTKFQVYNSYLLRHECIQNYSFSDIYA